MNDRFDDALQNEIAREKAESLARSERRMVAALQAFRQLETPGAPDPKAAAARQRRLWALVEAVTAFVVQREACGLNDAAYVLQHYEVPAEAVARIGARPPPDAA